MDANNSKSAEDSTATAQPADSQTASESAADHGEYVSKSELLAELGLPPEGQTADAADAAATKDQGQETEDSDSETEVDENAAEDTGTAEAETAETTDEVADAETAKSAEEAAQSDDAAAKTGESKDPKESETKAVHERINELTARAKSAEEEAARLREHLSTVSAQQSGALAPSALATVDDIAALQAQRDRYLFLHQWALENEDGGKLPAAKEGAPEVELGREEVARIKAQTFKLLNKDVPERAQYLAAKAAAEHSAFESYPWAKDTTKGDGAVLQQAIESLPALRQIPGYRLIAANALVGEKLRQAGIKVTPELIARLKSEQTAASGKTQTPKVQTPNGQTHRAPPPKAPSAPARAGVLPAKVAPRVAEQKAAAKRLRDSHGSMDALEAAIAAKL